MKRLDLCPMFGLGVSCRLIRNKTIRYVLLNGPKGKFQTCHTGHDCSGHNLCPRTVTTTSNDWILRDALQGNHPVYQTNPHSSSPMFIRPLWPAAANENTQMDCVSGLNAIP